MTRKSMLLIGLGLAFSAGALFAIVGPFTNGTFNGNLNGWNTASYAVAVNAQGNAVPQSGSWQALVASGSDDCPTDEARVGSPKSVASSSKLNKPRLHAPAVSKPGGTGVTSYYECAGTTTTDVSEATLESDIGLPSGSIGTALPDLRTPTLGSAMWQTFTVSAPTTLSFYWNFATNETVPSEFDGGLYTLQFNSNPATVVELASTEQTGILNQSTGSSPTFTTMTGNHQVTVTLSSAGTYTLGFIAMQTEDDDVSSGLYVSNVTVGGSPGVPTTPAPGTWVLLITGLAAVSVWSMRDRLREFLFHSR